MAGFRFCTVRLKREIHSICKVSCLHQLKLSFGGINLYTFLNRKWFFDKVYNEFVSQFRINTSYIVTYKLLDRGLIENCGPLGLS